jgi:hypothetical protein
MQIIDDIAKGYGSRHPQADFQTEKPGRPKPEIL